jgi:hypothetical protein
VLTGLIVISEKQYPTPAELARRIGKTLSIFLIERPGLDRALSPPLENAERNRINPIPLQNHCARIKRWSA